MSRRQLLVLSMMSCSVLTCDGVKKGGMNTGTEQIQAGATMSAADSIEPASVGRLPSEWGRRAFTDSKRVDPKLARLAVSRVTSPDPRPLLRLDTVLLGSGAWPRTVLAGCELDVRRQDQYLLVQNSKSGDLKPALRAALLRIQQAIDRVRDNLVTQQIVGQRGVRGEFERLLLNQSSGDRSTPGGVLVDMGQGPLTETTQALDLAIDGPGLFTVEYQDGDQVRRLYTRDGRFRLRKDGTLVCRTMPGARLASEVSLPPDATQLAVTTGGKVLTRSNPLQLLGERGRIKLTWFEHPEMLLLDRPGFLARTPEAGRLIEAYPTEDGLGSLRQGHIEGSNIDVLSNWSCLCLLEDARQLVIAMIAESEESRPEQVVMDRPLGVCRASPRPARGIICLRLPAAGVEEVEPAFLRFLRIRGTDARVGEDTVELQRGPETAASLVGYLKFLRKRLNVLAENIANASAGEGAGVRSQPHRRRVVRMRDDGQIEVVEDTAPARVAWEVVAAAQDQAGAPEPRLVEYSNVDLEGEMSEVDAVSREYRAVRQAIQQMGTDAVPALAAVLQDAPSEMQLDAALVLGEIGPDASAATPALLRLLESDDWDLREGVTGALGRIAPDSEVVNAAMVRAWSTAARSAAGPRRYRAVLTLGRLGPKAAGAVPVLAEMLDDPSSGAARALGQIGPAAAGAVPALIETLRRPESHVRQQTAEALGRIGPAARTAVPALLEAMRDKRPEVRWRVAAAIGRIGSNENGCIAALGAMLKDEDPRVRDRVAEALGRMGRPAGQVGGEIALAARANRAADRVWPLFALARGSDRPAAAILSLANLLLHSEDAAGVAACQAVGLLGPLAKPAVPALAELVNSGERRMAAAAIEALGELGPDAAEAVPQLAVALTHRDAFVRLRAATALGRIGECAAGAVPALTGRLDDESEQVVAACVEALGRIGPRAAEAAPALRTMAAHESASVRSVVSVTLARIGVDRVGPPTPTLPATMAGTGQDAGEP